MSQNNASIASSIALLAAASGARSMTGIAAVARARANAEAEVGPRRSVPRIVSKFDRQIANASTAMAVFELMADKAPHIADRVDPGPLFGRVAAGAVVGAAVARMTGGDGRGPAIAGAVIAFAAAHLTFRLRRALAREIPAFAAGLVEDALVLGVAAAGVALLRAHPASAAFERR